MDPSKPPSITALMHKMVEGSEMRVRKLAALRAAIASGTYRKSAAAIAEAVMRSMRG